MFQDLRYSLRVLASNRVVAGLSILCLSLAIGTNTTVFSFVNGLLLRPVPLASPERLLTLGEARTDDPLNGGPVSYPNFVDWREGAADLAEIAAARSGPFGVSDGAGALRYPGAAVSADLFRVFGVRPARGRGFLSSDEEPGALPAVILSDTLWRQRFDADPSIVGRTISVDGTPRTVVGVMPAELSHVGLPGVLRGARLWVPLAPIERDSPRDRRSLTVFARLAPGVSPAAAGARLVALARGLESTYPAANEGVTIAVQPLRATVSANTRAMLLMVMGTVTFVLLIACANVANLTLARAAGRRTEIATRLALGASRARIIRQVLSESLLLALLSVPPGIVLAYWGRDLLLGSAGSPELAAAIPIDTRVLLFTIVLALLSSVLSGFFPALHAVRRLEYDALRGTGRRQAGSGAPHVRLSSALIVAEVALALILLVGASLFVQSFRNLLGAEGGFDTSRILTAGVELAEGAATPAGPQIVNQIVDRLKGVPGVTSAAAANLMPLRDAGARTALVIEGTATTSGEPPVVLVGGITSGFFDVLGVPVVRGRALTDAEAAGGSHVAVINRTMARRFWPGEDAVGHRFRRAGDGAGEWFTIAGVSDDILTWDLSDRPLPTAYVPYSLVAVRGPSLFIRTDANPSDLARSARAAIQDVAPAVPVTDVRTMTEVHHLALARQQTLASLFTVVGVIALLLCATGVYGVLSWFVSQRKSEIGIRAALGADRRALVGLFVRQGMIVVLEGIILGLAGAWALARLIRGRLHDVSATDPLTFAAVALLLAAVALLAVYVPARRAAAVDPLVAIRE
jgi:putative ABC transport system permease protein